MTRQEKIKSYQENIFSAILDPKGISKENFEYLLEVIPTYLKIVLNIEEVDVVYEELRDNYGEISTLEDGIRLSKNYFSYKEEETDNVILLADLIQNCTHELYHAIDHREQNFSYSVREYQCWRHQEGVRQLSNFFPEKQKEYNNFAWAMYAISRNECFARQGGLIMLQDFVKDMKTFVITKYSGKGLGEQVEQIDKYIQQVQNSNNYENIPNAVPDVWALNNVISKCAIFETKVEFEEEKEKEIMKLSDFKKGMLGEIKEDLYKVSEIINADKTQNFDEKMLLYIATIQELEEFYDKKTLDNLIQYVNDNPNKRGLKYVCTCAELEALKRQQAQIKKEQTREL